MYLQLFYTNIVASVPLSSSINCLLIPLQEGTSKFANLDSSVKENQKRTQRRLQLQKDMVCLGSFPTLFKLVM